MRYNLSRLAITGLVTPSTPMVVLEEICQAHSISVDMEQIREPRYLARLLNQINTKSVNVVKEPYTRTDYKLIAKFVNRNHRWKEESLLKAFNLLLAYSDLNKLSEVHLDFNYGLQTHEEPENLNACVLYGICKVNRIETCLDTTIDEMARNIKLLFRLREPELNHSIRTFIHQNIIEGRCEGYQLVNILNLIDPTFSPEKKEIKFDIDYDELLRSAEEIKNRDIRALPRNHVEAVAMAALYYKMDISKVSNPLAEYQELGRDPHYPIDSDFAIRIQLSSEHPDSISNPHLDVIFNPELPSVLYQDYDLERLCHEEGYSDLDIETEGAYVILQTAYLLPTLLHGKQGNIINEENSLLEELDEVEYDEVVVYGVRKGEMRFYTYGELSDTFSVLKRFQKPDGDNNMFSSIEINKLYKLASKEKRLSESEEIYEVRIGLKNQIDRIKLYNQANQQQIHNLIYIYENTSNSIKISIQTCLISLLECSMYMRGWTGEGPYPLASEDASVPSEEQGNVEVRVIESIHQLENQIDIVEEDVDIGDLPLIFYHHRSDQLLPSTEEEEGLTIRERINIVKGGEDGSIQSCIRMSSNRFVASAYYYMRLLGMNLPFNIEEMSHIL